jgi:hypothetical protein
VVGVSDGVAPGLGAAPNFKNMNAFQIILLVFSFLSVSAVMTWCLCNWSLAAHVKDLVTTLQQQNDDRAELRTDLSVLKEKMAEVPHIFTWRLGDGQSNNFRVVHGFRQVHQIVVYNQNGKLMDCTWQVAGPGAILIQLPTAYAPGPNTVTCSIIGYGNV